jgi:hypothetical protein
MRAFLWVMAVLCLVSVFSKVKWVANDVYPARKRNDEVWDVLINLMIIMWIAVLINGGE